MESRQDRRDRQKKDSQKINREYLQLRRDHQQTYGSAAGRRVLESMILSSNLFHTTFTGTSGTFFQEGERAHLLEIMSYVPGIVGEVLQHILSQREAEIETEAIRILKEA